MRLRLRARRAGGTPGAATRFGAGALIAIALACLGSLPWTTARSAPNGPRRYETQLVDAALLPPWWAPHRDDERARRDALSASGAGGRFWLGTDRLGRDVLARCLVGGAISLGVGLAAATIAVLIGTSYGAIAGYAGGRTDAAMMRLVDILYGLPNVLLVVLLAVAVDGILERAGEDPPPAVRQAVNILALLAAIGSVIWLTMARVVRGQVLSLMRQPFMEACRATGVPLGRQVVVHLLPNILGPVIVYATLTVPTAILTESFLSFLGIGIREPLPSWGNLAASGLSELNVVRARWWLLLWPCLLVGVSLVALNFLGEGLRERFDPKRGGERS